MFSMLPAHKYTQSRYYTPHHPSPLSSSPLRNTTPSPLSDRNANIPSSPSQSYDTFPNDQIMSSPTPVSRSIFFTENNSPSFQQKSSPNQNYNKQTLPMSPPPSRGRGDKRGKEVFSKRAIKSNPLMNGRGEKADERETRRKLFLKGVREKGEEKRWRGRNGWYGEGEEEVLRTIWVKEERRREEKRKLEAEGWEVDVDDLGVMEEASRSQIQDEDMESLMWEESELMEVGMDEKRPETPYASDDEEYDSIFMDVIEEEKRMASQQQQQQPAYLDQDSDMMDMS